jgi:hypothetical protein
MKTLITKAAILGSAIFGLSILTSSAAFAQTTVHTSGALPGQQTALVQAPTPSTGAYVTVPAVPNVTPAKSVVLPGLANIPRHYDTAAYDGCQKVQKGLIMGGGFLVFTCEKLLPGISIKKHRTAFNAYKQTLMDAGWTVRADQKQTEKKAMFKRMDMTGCEAELDISLWTDRSMNEPPRDALDRNNHRQIVFMARFYGDACEHYYPIAETLAMNGN